jgi:hypothetical protein
MMRLELLHNMERLLNVLQRRPESLFLGADVNVPTSLQRKIMDALAAGKRLFGTQILECNTSTGADGDITLEIIYKTVSDPQKKAIIIFPVEGDYVIIETENLFDPTKYQFDQSATEQEKLLIISDILKQKALNIGPVAPW